MGRKSKSSHCGMEILAGLNKSPCLEGSGKNQIVTVMVTAQYPKTQCGNTEEFSVCYGTVVTGEHGMFDAKHLNKKRGFIAEGWIEMSKKNIFGEPPQYVAEMMLDKFMLPGNFDEQIYENK